MSKVGEGVEQLNKAEEIEQKMDEEPDEEPEEEPEEEIVFEGTFKRENRGRIVLLLIPLLAVFLLLIIKQIELEVIDIFQHTNLHIR